VRALLLLPLLVLAACAAEPGGAGATPTSGSQEPTDAAGHANDLRISLDRGDGRESEEYTLVCADAAEGSHPDARAACDHLLGLENPFAPVPDDAVCTEIYGGPQTARVTGAWAGEPVDLELSRVDGCRITQWDALGPLLPGPVGVEPPD
jgi:hypothetical protein